MRYPYQSIVRDEVGSWVAGMGYLLRKYTRRLYYDTTKIAFLSSVCVCDNE
jgi:hypothetical protein